MPKVVSPTLFTKRKILGEVGNIPRKDICAKYSIAKSTLSLLIKKKDELENFKGNPKKRKSVVQGKVKTMDEVLMGWITEQRANGIPLSCSLIKEKARTLDPNGNKKYSNGWFEKFQKRNNLTHKRICGEELEVDLENLDNWKLNVLAPTTRNYSDSDIFNADESALFFKKLPGTTFDVKGKKCFGLKASKERVTFLACCNKTGDQKQPLLIIGKSKNPRCFKNTKFASEFTYRSSKRAWMTRELFSEWLATFNSNMADQKRKVLLILDNFSGHVVEEELFPNLQLLFLPPNTTSKSQPLDCGIIQSLKQNYCHQIVKVLDSGKDLNDVKLSVGIEMLCQSWNDVKQETIVNCFRKSEKIG